MSQLVLVLAAVGTTCAAYGALGWMGDTRVQGVRASEVAMQALTTEGWQLDRFRIDDDAELAGLMRPPAKAGQPWVLGFAGNSPAMTKEMRAFLSNLRGDRDWGLATWAYRGFDGSSGVTRGSKVASDAQAIFEHLVDRASVTPRLVHVVGFSLGTAFAAHLGARLRTGGVELGSLTLLSPGLTGPRVPRWMAPFVRGGFQLRTLIDDLPTPLLVVGAAGDRVHPVDFNARLIRDRLGSRVEYEELPGDHAATVSSELALETIRRHIDRAAR